MIRPCKLCVKTKRYLLRTFSFLEDSLAAPGVNAAVEGADATMIALDAQVERTNTTQILTKGFQISATADAVATYGRKTETALNLAKKLKEIKRDYEHALVGVAQATVVGNATSSAEDDFFLKPNLYNDRCRKSTLQMLLQKQSYWKLVKLLTQTVQT